MPYTSLQTPSLPLPCVRTLWMVPKSLKTSNLVMRNNLRKERPLARSSLIYQFECPFDGCVHPIYGKQRYVGHTRCTLSRRLSMHLMNGSIKEHCFEKHNCKISRSQIVDNTSIRYYESDPVRLRILEALVIKFEKPCINSQETGLNRILRLYLWLSVVFVWTLLSLSPAGGSV